MVQQLVPRSVKQYVKRTLGLTRIDTQLAEKLRLLTELHARLDDLEGERLRVLAARLDELEGGRLREMAARLAEMESKFTAACQRADAVQVQRETTCQALELRLARVEQALNEVGGNLPGQWRQDIIFEAVVVLALRDLCRPGTVVFDCGANVGLLTILMSRLVGPRGEVCAFEASPRVVDLCQRNLAMNGCHNTTLYHAAVFSRSDEMIPIYFGDHLQADSVMTRHAGGETGQVCRVPTLAVDDLVRRTGLVPDLIKMDIEGAEYEAVCGMRATIEQTRPHLILETQTDDERCLRLLRSVGYRAIDLNNYREVVTRADFPPGTELRNLLYIHEDRLGSTDYELPFRLEEVAQVRADDCLFLDDGSVRQKEPVRLATGRYVIDVDAAAEGSDNEMRCGVRSGDVDLFLHHCNTRHIFQSYRDWVINLTEPTPIRLFFEFHAGTTDPTFRFAGATVRRVTRFDGRPVQLVI